MFDEYRNTKNGEWPPFDPDADYRRYVDGKPRYEGMKSILDSREIDLPYSDRDDRPGKETICGLGNLKNEIFHTLLRKSGVEVYGPAVQFLRKARQNDFKTAVVSSSKNCSAVLKFAGIEGLFDVKVDGVIAHNLDLSGKPSPDIFIEGASRLDVQPEKAVVFEDALSGMAAGRRGGFALVVGMDRTYHKKELQDNGADAIIEDFNEIMIENNTKDSISSALQSIDEILDVSGDKPIAVFLDYDGTLTPIVDDPAKALLPSSMKETLRELTRHFIVAIISGRALEDVRNLVNIKGIIYAGSHGFEISGTEADQTPFQKGEDFLPSLDKAEQMLREKLEFISDAVVERKKYSIAVHYRKVPEDKMKDLVRVVNAVAAESPKLRKSQGKKIYELQPDIDWHKGKALFHILDSVEADPSRVIPLYMGDDTTDEDAFKSLSGRGVGIVVMEQSRATAADYQLKNSNEVETFLRMLIASKPNKND